MTWGVAAKHDAKKARGNYWVMQQNMAKWKGNQFWMSKPKHASMSKPTEPVAPPSPLAELVATPEAVAFAPVAISEPPAKAS